MKLDNSKYVDEQKYIKFTSCPGVKYLILHYLGLRSSVALFM